MKFEILALSFLSAALPQLTSTTLVLWVVDYDEISLVIKKK